MEEQFWAKSGENSHKSLFWTAYSNLDRIEGIQKAEACITAHGFITDFKEFSDLGINICIEIDGFKVGDLYAALSANFSMDPFEPAPVQAGESKQIYLNISFKKGSGNLSTVVPEVPG